MIYESYPQMVHFETGIRSELRPIGSVIVGREEVGHFCVRRVGRNKEHSPRYGIVQSIREYAHIPVV